MLTEKSSNRTLAQFTTRLAVNVEYGLWGIHTEQVWEILQTCLCSNVLKETCVFHTSDSAYLDMGTSLFGLWLDHNSSKHSWKLIPDDLPPEFPSMIWHCRSFSIVGLYLLPFSLAVSWLKGMLCQFTHGTLMLMEMDAAINWSI